MKIQNGFISSSSSVSTSYQSFYVGEKYDHTTTTITTSQSKGNAYSVVSQAYDSYNTTLSSSWRTYESTCYERIEYFLEAVETLGEPYSKANLYWQNLSNYSAAVAVKNNNIYNGFVDLVITFPCEIRLAGIELINPWVSDRFDSTYSEYWTYLPESFNIYKVNTTDKDGNKILNEALEEFSYENDVARISTPTSKKYNPLKYNRMKDTDGLTLLGSYKNINWKGKSSCKCFFKYNANDQASINITAYSDLVGTATWECKQLVIRIFSTKRTINHLNVKDASSATGDTYIKNLIYEYILEKELSYGTTYNGFSPTINNVKDLFGVENISSKNNPTGDESWKFGNQYVRSYKNVSDIKFKSGIEYKLGGIQLLISPDIFSIAEMKMYDYAGRDQNKVYIGEYDANTNLLYYYGAKNTKQSPFFDIDKSTNLIVWKHNFNIPASYLDAKVYIRFNMEYDNFKVGDIVDNIVNVQNAPLSLKLTDNEVSISLVNGIGFTNPDTGEFISFMNGIGIQMDRPGNYDALNAAIDVKANIIEAGSSVAAYMTGGCPFQIYFVVRRLF